MDLQGDSRLHVTSASRAVSSDGIELPEDTPNWLLPFMDMMNHQFEVINKKLDRMDHNLDLVRRIAVRSHNASCLDGMSKPYLVVNNKDGIDPTQPPNNLPPIGNITALNTMSGDMLTCYLDFYGLEHCEGLYRRRLAIGKYIGISVPVAYHDEEEEEEDDEENDEEAT
ncbi:hypothetical protein HDU76_001205 [Blyttiomyces sp. JEL0837]|nr:hypothetical protein HDU76_001205 [Blyttiomyces sp. JEL0837]